MAAQIVLSRKHGGDCILCMCRPVDHEGRVKPMFTAVGVDVNWGENANICVVCAGVMADLLGRPPQEEVEKLKQRYETLTEQHESLEEEYVEQGALIDKIREGAKAQKKVRAA